jgi:hypothetical protein
MAQSIQARSPSVSAGHSRKLHKSSHDHPAESQCTLGQENTITTKVVHRSNLSLHKKLMALLSQGSFVTEDSGDAYEQNHHKKHAGHHKDEEPLEARRFDGQRVDLRRSRGCVASACQAMLHSSLSGVEDLQQSKITRK